MVHKGRRAIPRPSKQERRRLRRKDIRKESRVFKQELRRSINEQFLTIQSMDLADDLSDRLDVEMAEGYWERAEYTASRLVRLEPDEIANWGRYVQCAIAAGGGPAETAPILESAVSACPDEPYLRALLVSALVESGREHEARLALDQAMERFEGDMWSYMRRVGLVRGRQKELLGWRKTMWGARRTGPPPPPPPDDGHAGDDDDTQVEIDIEPPVEPGRRRARQPRPARRDARPAPAQATVLDEMPLPEPDAASTPLAFASSVDHGLLEALVDGREDGPRAVLLAARAVDVLAEEGFDKLVALEKVRGVERLGYQIETAMRVMRRFRGRVLLSDEVGLGKTVEAGLVMLEYMERGLAGRCLVLVPPALVGQWREELASKFGIEATTTRDPAFRRDPAGFWSRPGTIVASLATARSELHAERIAAERFDLLVVDEAHHVKNRSTAGWKLVNSIRSRFFLMLTATPVETDLSELYNLVTVLRPGTLGTEADFRARFVDPDDPSRPRDADGLRRLLSDVMIRNTRATCGVMLPPRTARTVLVAPTAAEAALYGRLVDMSRRARGRSRNLVRLLMEEAGSTPAALARTAERSLRAGADPDLASDLEAVSREAAALETTAKLEALARILPGDPVLVFSRFRNSLERIAAHLTARSVRLGLYHGGLDAAEKDRAVDDLRAGRTDVLLCSGIGGEGRNLQFCRRLVNFDLPWNPMTIEQRIGRIHRIGQTGHVEVVNLATAGTAEERILDVLDARVNMFELVVGEMDMVLGETVDERDFGDRVYDIYATSENEDGVERGFDALADELLEARRKLERTHALDEELFGEEYGT